MILLGFVLSIWFVAYLILPEKITGKKHEYITCIGSSITLFTFLFVLIVRVFLTADKWQGLDNDTNFLIGYWIFLSFYHRIYPFSMVKRNQRVTFLLLATTLPFLFFWACLWLLVYFSDM